MRRVNRVATGWAGLAAAVLVAVIASAGGCALFRTTPEEPELEEPARVERLRTKITQVRNAIDETRRTISRSRGAPFLPELYLRLAELLSEEARYHYQLAAERQQSSGGLTNVPEVELLKQKAIETYRKVVSRFEDADEVPQALFNLGHEHRELGNFDKMKWAFDKLIEEHPDSGLRDDALLVLGDHYFDKSELKRAGEYYRQIIQGETGATTGLGYYKLAWVNINENRCERALSQFESAIASAREWRNRGEMGGQGVEVDKGGGASGSDIDVRREALVDLTYCYSREREADDALDYLSQHAHARSAYVAALGRLAQRYRLNENYEGTVLVTRELLKLGPSNRDRLEDARTFYTALKSQAEFRRLGRDARSITDALTDFYSHAPMRSEERQRLRTEFEKLVRDLTTRAQTQLKRLRGESVPDDAPGGNQDDPPDDLEPDDLAGEVIEGYRAYLETFPEAESVPAIRLNLSEILADQGEHLEAGRQALSAAERMEESERQRNALYDAAVAFQNSLDQEVDRRQFERVRARGSLRRTARRLLNYNLTEERDRRVKYAVAQSYYDEGQYLRAIDQLTAVAYEYPDSQEADAAVRLVLDGYDTLNDYDGLRYASRRFLRDNSPAGSKLRNEIQNVLEDARQRKLDELSLDAAGDRGESLKPLLEFADEHAGETMGKRALVNAFVAARAMGKTSRMYDLADRIASDYPDAERLPDIYKTVAEMARTRFEFERAVDFLERAAEVDASQRSQLLTAAGAVYEQVGLPTRAEEAYRRAIEAGEGASAPAGKLAMLLEGRATAEEMVRKLEPYAGTGNPELLARLGLARVATGDVEGAETAFEAVLEGGSGASAGATARAKYGMAETLFDSIRNFGRPDSVQKIQKLTTLIEVGQQKYVAAARQGSPLYTAVALNRLASMLEFAADKLEELEMPASLGSAQRQQVQKALESRIASTRKGAKDAFDTCAGQIWEAKNFTRVVRKCLNEEKIEGTFPPFESEEQGSIGGGVSGVEELRERVAKNPQDAEALKKIGVAFLEAGRPHTAKVVFSQSVGAGGGATHQNLLGLARYRAGDHSGAFGAFLGAAEGGLEAGRQNLVELLRDQGFDEQAKKALERLPEGESGGRRIGGGK